MPKTSKKLMNTYPDFNDLLLEDLKDEEFAKEYLRESFREYLEDGNKEVFMRCLKPLVQAQGSVSEFAEKIGLNRTYLYKIFGCRINPDFSTIVKIIDNLGFELSFNIKKRKYAH